MVTLAMKRKPHIWINSAGMWCCSIQGVWWPCGYGWSACAEFAIHSARTKARRIDELYAKLGALSP